MRADQEAFVAALLGRGDPPASLNFSERGLAAYRNNLRALSSQALAVAFERLRSELGQEEFASLAWSFWRHHPPAHGDLGLWGEALESFLIERAGEASGLPDLARLDWALHRAERAADAELDVDSLQHLATQSPDELWLQLRPGVSLLAQSDGPVLVWREGWRGTFSRLSMGEASFFRSVLDRLSLADALERCEVKGSGVEVDFDFSAWLQAALKNGWLCKVSTSPPNPSPSL